MGPKQWFYQTDAQWNAIREQLKQTPCPHCKRVGMLIGHGFLRGYDDTSPQRKTIRARRIFCSNRHARQGCGRTFNVWLADRIRRSSLTTRSLWQLLRNAITGSLTAAIRAIGSPLSDRTLQRAWRRFHLAQSRIRTALFGLRSPPDPPDPSPHPTAQVLAHLRAAFPDADCPITAFQLTTHSFIL